MTGRRRWPVLVLLGAVLAAGAWRAATNAGARDNVFAANVIGAARDDGGLRLAISVPRWRFFRGELVPVTLTLTNHTGRTVHYSGALRPALCRPSALNATAMRNGQYVSPIAVALSYHCPMIPLMSSPLAPGASLTARLLLGIPTSGRLTLAAQASFAMGESIESAGLLEPSRMLDGLRHLVPGLFRSRHVPFALGGPSLTIAVLPHVPASRTLRLLRRGHVVYLQGYRSLPGAVGQEAEEYVTGQGVCMTGQPLWMPLAAGALRDQGSQGCGASIAEAWQALAGAPGYAIASAVYCFNPSPSGSFYGIAGRPMGLLPPCTERITERHR